MRPTYDVDSFSKVFLQQQSEGSEVGAHRSQGNQQSRQCLEGHAVDALALRQVLQQLLGGGPRGLIPLQRIFVGRVKLHEAVTRDKAGAVDQRPQQSGYVLWLG